MRSCFVPLFILLIVSCSSMGSMNSKECKENLSFKKEFFESIDKINKYVDGNGDREEFNKSLTFLSKYVKVSNDKMLNYNNSYTTKNDFLNDKKTWLDWYEMNKCDNIQFK